MVSTVAVGRALAKRLVEDPPNWPDWKLPSYAFFIFVGDFFLFLPALIILGYTFQYVYATLAAIEDPLPAYEAVPGNDDGTPKDVNDPVGAAGPRKPVTSSLRATHRLLRSVSGGFSSFRGLGYAIVVALLTGTATGFFSLAPFVPLRLAHLFATLALAPLSTTLTHLVVTPVSATPFFRRVPPLRKVYVATWLPIALAWLAEHAVDILPTLLAQLIGLPTHNQRWQKPTGSVVAQVICVVGVAVGLQALLVVPTRAALARVQASLLPADQDTIVPFDRSFGGRVEPEVVSGRGFATFGAALATIPVRSWVRIYLLRVKVFAISVAVFAAMGALVAAQILLLRKMCDGEDGEGAKGYKCY